MRAVSQSGTQRVGLRWDTHSDLLASRTTITSAKTVLTKRLLPRGCSVGQMDVSVGGRVATASRVPGSEGRMDSVMLTVIDSRTISPATTPLATSCAIRAAINAWDAWVLPPQTAQHASTSAQPPPMAPASHHAADSHRAQTEYCSARRVMGCATQHWDALVLGQTVVTNVLWCVPSTERVSRAVQKAKFRFPDLAVVWGSSAHVRDTPKHPQLALRAPRVIPFATIRVDVAVRWRVTAQPVRLRGFLMEAARMNRVQRTKSLFQGIL
eukprot:m.1636315 g.1636315  ORF g.1636315 m.1636315 type:complete len:268 (-) comp25423_c0_seq8:9423-10226(-)